MPGGALCSGTGAGLCCALPARCQPSPAPHWPPTGIARLEHGRLRSTVEVFWKANHWPAPTATSEGRRSAPLTRNHEAPRPIRTRRSTLLSPCERRCRYGLAAQQKADTSESQGHLPCRLGNWTLTE
ncbi:uncharacterized protein SETTUDRAFT_18641 [Exserohilum turcica Et28A]|uniref:Uncharacterized protein n=1 Tax=Exserohilum turcicum (strain 28A) TaxID=671987 RepID=R0J5G1_EXST2|nr:uncharacterized protein SETTUDRAFT_18641 [Exserohilum turcica Et28A]EOA91981.1 hypothetical protein SETTUDRAFT_18641 [Exserohilum turcica Et28A]